MKLLAVLAACHSPVLSRLHCGGAGVHLDSFGNTTLQRAQLAGNNVGGVARDAAFPAASLQLQDSLVARAVQRSAPDVWQLPPQLLPQPIEPGPYGWCADMP